VLQAYHQFYRQFDKTYHVQLQLESIIFKNKPLPRGAALVESMFMAELKNFLLTAGHDLDAVQGDLHAEIAQGGERFIQLNGQEAALKAGDMFISDATGILSSVLYGPDQRTAIQPLTRRVVFTVYAPAGIDDSLVLQHLDDIEANIHLFTPAAHTDIKTVYP
jgi:DNA/RNA-binding domain of Phe-tRNA-synthetase-like protein